ncbi:hypothetical protein [Leptospira interrogans]|nr:hypothetical protein [Leptospira interrogans]
MIENILKNIQEFLKERVSSPLLLSFTLSWTLMNWKILYILIGSEKEFSLIERLLYVDNNLINSWYNICAPALFSLLFVIIYPFASVLVVAIWSFADHHKKKIVNKIYKQRLLTLDQSIRLTQDFERREEEYISLIDRKNNQIEKLKRNLEDFSETEVEILGETGTSPFVKILQKKFPEEENAIRHIIGIITRSERISDYT